MDRRRADAGCARPNRRRGGRTRPQPGRSHRLSGVTLIEMLVALTVAGVIAVAVHATVSMASDALARVDDGGARSLSAATARRSLQRWLRAAARFEGGGPFIGRDAARGAVPNDEVVFAVVDGGPLHPGPHRIRMWIDADPSTARRGLLAALEPIRGGAAVPTEPVEVARAAVGLSVRYRTTDAGTVRWLRDWRSADALPEAVELRVIGPPATGERTRSLPRLLSLPLIVPLGDADR